MKTTKKDKDGKIDSGKTWVKKCDDGTTFYSFDNCKTWEEKTQIEWDKKHQGIKQGFKDAVDLTFEGKYVNFWEQFGDMFIDSCEKGNIKGLKRGYYLSVKGYKKNLPDFNKIDFITFLIIKSQKVIESQYNKLSFGALTTGNQFIEFLERKKIGLSSPKQKDKAIIPSTFEDLFVNKKDIQFCIEVLQKVEPPIIDKNCNFILGVRSKGAFVAYVQVLNYRNKINYHPVNVLSKLLNNKFHRLSITDRTLRNPCTKAYHKYLSDLKVLIN